MATADNLIELTATEAVAAMQRGEIAAEAYATALLARAQQCADLNAFRTIDPERVLEAARAADKSRSAGAALGPMHGLPIAVKDSVNTADYPTSAGHRKLRDFRPKADAAVLKPLKAAGAIVMGKTNLHELSFGWTSNNECFGSVHNPHDRTRIPGGSSGGRPPPSRLASRRSQSPRIRSARFACPRVAVASPACGRHSAATPIAASCR